jgi:D-amino-acid oxidase
MLMSRANMLSESHIYRREVDIKSGGSSFDSMFSPNPWFSRLFPDFRELEKHELPEGVFSGCEYTGICINVAVYLPWLVGQCRKRGVVFRRGTVSHIREVKEMHHSGEDAQIIINASGLGSKTLGGVADSSMMPIRGQIAVVENEALPMYNISGTDDGPDEVSYVMTRAAGGGTILGGTYQRNNWDPEPDPETTKRIIKRAVKLSPSLAKGKGVEGVKIIRSGVGLRPYREGGVRVEADLKTLDGTLIVHNYGHAGWGYQGSYGTAKHVVELVTDHLQKAIEPKKLRSKL